jgi:hypothetical protein
MWARGVDDIEVCFAGEHNPMMIELCECLHDLGLKVGYAYNYATDIPLVIVGSNRGA